MDFTFGCAKKLYERGVHPRMFIGPGDIPALKKRIRSGRGKRIMSAMRRIVAPTIAAVMQSGDLPTLLKHDRKNAFGATASHHLRHIALVGALDEDADAIEAARRVLSAKGGSFGYGFGPQAFDLLYPHLSAEDRSAFVSAGAAYIRKQVAESSSHYLMHAGGNLPLVRCMEGPLACLLAIRGEPDAGDIEAEQAELLTFFEAALNVVFNPDGYPEEDMGYGTFIAARMADLAEPLRRAGLYDAYRQCPHYARFGQAVLHFVQPWGEHLSNTGDHGDDFAWRELILARQAAETRDPALLWLLGTLSYVRDEEVSLRKGFQTPATLASLMFADDFKKARHPSKTNPPTQYRDRLRGIVSFRSGWRADDTFVVFDGSQRSPSAQGHAHASCGHFSLSALGEYFGIDTGRYNIEQNCHNVVLVDGKSGHSTEGEWSMTLWNGNLTEYKPGDFVDFAAADSSHQHNCYWARRYLGLVKGTGAPSYVWTVEDVNKANDWAEFWWQLHTSPENTITTREDSATIRGRRHGNLLDVHFALPSKDSYPKPHTLTLAQDEATISSYNYIRNPRERMKRYARPADAVHYAVFVRPRLLAKVGGYNGRFMALMIPRRKGERPAKVERLPSLDNSLAVKISFGNVEDTLIWAYEHNLLEAGDVKGRGRWCLVRRARADGKPRAFQMGDGVSLSVGRHHIIQA